MVSGVPWHNALLAAEGVAFPSGEQFVAFCMAGKGPAAEFVRESSRDYRIIENGVVDATSAHSGGRVRTSDLHFNDRQEWAAAVSRLGERLQCEALRVIFPPTDSLRVEVDTGGRLIRVAVPAVD
jgi:hypothetical protein